MDLRFLRFLLAGCSSPARLSSESPNISSGGASGGGGPTALNRPERNKSDSYVLRL